MKIHHLLRPPPVALLLNSTLPHILRVAAVAILNCWMASMCSNVRHARECMIARFHPSPLRKEIWWVDEKKKMARKKWRREVKKLLRCTPSNIPKSVKETHTHLAIFTQRTMNPKLPNFLMHTTNVGAQKNR